MIITALTTSCHWKTLVHFCLQNKKPKKHFNINRELSQNRAEKQIMPFKTTDNSIFNDVI